MTTSIADVLVELVWPVPLAQVQTCYPIQCEQTDPSVNRTLTIDLNCERNYFK